MPLKFFTVFVLPGEKIAVKGVGLDEIILTNASRIARRQGTNDWLIQSPSKSTRIAFYANQREPIFTLQLLVMTPFSQLKDGFLEGYQIGQYPAPHGTKPEKYVLPSGFLSISPQMVDMKLTPHLTLRKFISKQKSDFPKFAYLDSKLLLMLESFLTELNRQGYDLSGFGIVSGYRTPYYNASLGNIEYSRHIYGDAADIYVDKDLDSKMDDLNKDGLVNASDTKFFYGLAERFLKMHKQNDFTGGLGLYLPTKRHGGFIHMDTRGYRERWENQYEGN